MEERNNKSIQAAAIRRRTAWWLQWKQSTPTGKLTLAIITLAYVSVLVVGLSGTEPMVADEVIHYYMLVTQAGKLPSPNVDVEIPMAGWVCKRAYPHVFLWHYVGAMIWLACGQTFWSVQVYQSLFWLQLLIATWLLARMEKPENPRAVFLCVASLASLPMGLLFSVLLFQDVPATAQVMTSFLFLRRRRMWLSLLFMGLALSIKVTTFPFLPVYLMFIIVFYRGTEVFGKTLLRLICAVMIIIASCAPMAAVLHELHWNYYPTTTLKKYMDRFEIRLKRDATSDEKAGDSTLEPPVQQAPTIVRPEIANHPGDLRTPANWIIYGGGIFWILVMMGAIGFMSSLCVHGVPMRWRELWPFGVGIWYLLVTAYHMRTAPDARFFLPGIPFVLIALSKLAVRLPWRRVWLPLILAGSLLQGGAVLVKTLSLRRISPGILEAIEVINRLEKEPRNLFMYPEGHERFVRGSVDWDLQYELQDFWRADNDLRIQMLAKRQIGIIVVKKRRIKQVSPNTHDLGVYPNSFVEDLQNDARFIKVFENSEVMIFLVPALEKPR